MICYFDNSATTKCLDGVVEKMNEMMREHYGNPSSLHNMGFDAEKELNNARQIIAKSLKASDKEIVFTSGGTESNNLALIGTAIANRRAGKHIITSAIEHPSINEPLKFLEEEGYEVTCLPVDSDGLVSLNALRDSIRDDTILVSIMHINNEIGSVQPLDEIGKLVKAENPKCLFHADATQSFGKYAINPKSLKIDLLSASGHKIHGPKGVGLLYINKNVKIVPIIFGGGQQKGLRSGTENVPGIAGMARAADLLYKDFDDKMDRLYGLKTYFVDELQKLEGVTINGLSKSDGVRNTAPHIVSSSVDGIRAEVLLHALEEKEIYVSSGSACSSGKVARSATLAAMGVPSALAGGALRVSLGWNTVEEDVSRLLHAFERVVTSLYERQGRAA